MAAGPRVLRPIVARRVVPAVRLGNQAADDRPCRQPAEYRIEIVVVVAVMMTMMTSAVVAVPMPTAIVIMVMPATMMVAAAAIAARVPIAAVVTSPLLVLDLLNL